MFLSRESFEKLVWLNLHTKELLGIQVFPNLNLLCIFFNENEIPFILEIRNLSKQLQLVKFYLFLYQHKLEMCTRDCCLQEVKCCCFSFGINFCIAIILEISLLLITLSLIMYFVYLYGNVFWKYQMKLVSQIWDDFIGRILQGFNKLKRLRFKKMVNM